MNASEIMTIDPVFVDAAATTADVIERLLELDVRHLPVMDKGQLIGMISDRDLRELSGFVPTDPRSVQAHRDTLDAPIANHLRGGALSVDTEEDLGTIVDLMIDHKIGAVPVVSQHEGTLVGIISTIDVLRAARDIL